MLLCALILVCAFNPSLSQALGDMVTGMVNAETDGTDGDISVPMPGEEGTVVDETPGDGGNSGITGGGQAVNGVYVPPAQEDVVSPDSVKDRNGYEPVQENGQEIDDKAAEDIQQDLEIGDTGEDVTFDTALYPYYGMLNQDQQALYRQIYANALELTASFAPVVPVSVKEVKNVFEAVYNDHPELFWVETSYACKYLKSGQCIELTLQYYNIANDLEEAEKQFDAAAQEILDGAERLSNDAEKERYVHDALIEKVDYHAGTAMGQSAYSALVSGRSVCAGYARAYQYLMMELGIPCYYCTGYSGEDHAWNIVKLDDGYYNVDVTWDDTKPSTYDYFNKTDADYAGTHMRKGMSVQLPVCTGEEYRREDTTISQPVEGENQTEGTTASNQNSTDGDATEESADDTYTGVDDYINDYPTKPLTWSNGSEVTEEDREKPWEEIGLKEEDILDNLEEYYADCLKQMKKAGSGYQQFTNVIPKSMWQTIEQIYSDGSYEKGYVDAALKELKMENFAIQLQTERLNGNYYRLYHNISTW